MASLRSCTTVEVTECEEFLYAAVSGKLVCTTYYESICDDAGGTSGRCQECTGSTDGGSSSGGSSGSSGTTTEPTYNHPTDSDPSSAYTNLNESQYYHLRQQGFTEEQVAAFNIVYGNLLAETGDFQWPITEEELNDFVTILMYEMLNLETLIDLVVPGFADIKSAIEKFKNSSYWGGTFDLAMALVDLFPASKITKASLVVAVKVRRSSKILDIFKIVKRLGNQKMYKGFKKTIVNEYKNPHIFQVKQGHLGDPNFEDLIKWAGGQQELIAKVYEKVYKEGLHNGIPSNIPREFIIFLDGKKVRGRVIDLPSLDQIRIDDFWYQN